MIRIWVFGFWLGCCLVGGADFRAGVAVRVVTPDPLVPVSGGVGPSHPVTEKRGELTVRALVFQQSTTRVAMVSGDFLGFPRWLGDRVRARVRGIPAENILIGATHTHSAPDCYGFPDDTGRTTANPAYLEMVCTRMAEAIQEACDHVRPAALKLATGEAKGKIAYNYYAPQLYDPRCHVIQVVDEAGRPIATLVNYAIHPEVLGSDRGVLSPDLCGPLYDRIATQGGGTAIFFNSAQGGMVTADVRRSDGGENNTWEECVRIGELLAALVRQLPGADQAMEVDAVRTRLNVVNLGNAQILTIPGEALPNIGYYLKRKMAGKHNFLFGLTNDAYGYLLARVDYASFPRYEYITRTSLGEMAGEVFVEEALRLALENP